MNSKVKETGKMQTATGKSSIAWGINGSTILAISTPFFYLNGKAYHDGYLSYFKLNSSMFPLDTSATFVAAVLAWFHAMSSSLTSLLGIIGQHWQRTFFIGLGIILILAVFNYLIEWLTQKLNGKKSPKPQQQLDTQTPSFLKELGKSALYVFLPSYGLFLLMVIIAMILLTTTQPFVSVGAEAAADDLKSGFNNSPWVSVSDPDGHKSSYRVMECSALFCALYADGKVITVPIATLNWAVSDVSDELKALETK